MRVTSKGQVTIPAAIRLEFGFLPDAEVEFVVEEGSVRLRHVRNADQTRGDRVVRRLRGSAGSGLSTDEIMALTRES